MPLIRRKQFGKKTYSHYSHGQRMSNLPCQSGRMNAQLGYCPVSLEPDLEKETALLTPAQRRVLAGKYRRWARQLEISAFIMNRNQESAGAPPAAHGLKPVPRRSLVRN